jgi:hypothetical protein
MFNSDYSKFIGAAYGVPKNDSNEPRWQKLRDTDCASFLLIGMSYTPLDIGEMCPAQFNYLVGTVKNFQQAKALPPKWFFVKKFNLQ